MKAVNRETDMVTVNVSPASLRMFLRDLKKLKKKKVYSYRGGKRQDWWVWLWTSGLGQST